MFATALYITIDHIKKQQINYSGKMKKNYVKPCSSCVAMAAEQAMLVGSKGLRVTNENRVSPKTQLQAYTLKHTIS